MRNPRWFLQTLPQGQVAVPGAEFIVDWAGRVDSIKSVHVSLSSSPPPLGRLWGCLSFLESVLYYMVVNNILVKQYCVSFVCLLEQQNNDKTLLIT